MTQRKRGERARASEREREREREGEREGGAREGGGNKREREKISKKCVRSHARTRPHSQMLLYQTTSERR